jgi:hypothetical protein
VNYIDGDDVIDGDDESANVLGAVARQLARRGSPRRVFTSPPLPARPVQGNTAELRSYMGFGFVTWTGADGADKVITIEPQESFRGERLVIDVIASAPAAGLTLLRRIDIGTMPQSPSVEQAAPASMFARDATGAQLDLQIAYRGTKVQITLGQTVAPGGAVVVTAAVGMFGQWIR